MLLCCPVLSASLILVSASRRHVPFKMVAIVIVVVVMVTSVVAVVIAVVMLVTKVGAVVVGVVVLVTSVVAVVVAVVVLVTSVVAVVVVVVMVTSMVAVVVVVVVTVIPVVNFLGCGDVGNVRRLCMWGGGLWMRCFDLVLVITTHLEKPTTQAHLLPQIHRG